MGLIGSIADAVSAGRTRRRLGAATNDYEERLDGLMGQLPQYEGPAAFQQMEAALTGPAKTYDPTMAAFGDAGAAMGDVDTLYGDYNPVDSRNTAYNSVRLNAADAINMAGGRRADQQRAAERAFAQAAPGIENQYANNLQQLALAKGSAGQNVLSQRTNLNTTNANAANSAGQFNTGQINQVDQNNATRMQGANQFNAAGQNAFNQTQANNAFASDQWGFNQQRSAADDVFGARTGQANQINQLNQQMGQGIQGAVQSGAGAAFGGAVMGPFGAIAGAGNPNAVFYPGTGAG